MIRIFCDLCDKPADAKREYRVEQNVGEPVSEYRVGSDGSGCQKLWQCKIVATASFKFVDQKGCRETPDLCDACAKVLIAKIPL